MNKDIFKWIVLGCLFSVPFVPFLVSGSLFFPFITTKAFGFRILVEIAFGAWLVLAALVPEYRPKKSVILYSLLTFLLIIGLADLFGAAPIKSFWSNYERMEGYITLLHLGAYFLIVGSMFKEREWKWWWNTSLIASFLMVLYSASQLLGMVPIHQGGVRVDGTFGNAAYLAVYLLIHIFVALMFMVREWKNSLIRWTYILLTVSLVVILYYTATRGAILGLIGGLGIVALLNIRNKESAFARKASRSLLVGLTVIVVGFFFARHTAFVTNSPVLQRFGSISSAELKTEGRSFVWPMALQGIKEKPLLGWGQENFNYVFNEHYSPKMYNLEPWFDRAHNIFLDWGISGGILGLLSYLSLYGVLLYAIWKKQTTLTHVDKSLLTGLLAAYFFHNLFVFDHLLSYILFVSLLAYLHSLTALEIKKVGITPLSNQKALMYVAAPAALVLIFLLYTVNIRPINANSNLILALQSTQSGTNIVSALPYFRSAYNGSRLGRPEVVEWISTSANSVLGSSISNEDKTAYFNYAKEVVEKQATELSTDARYQLLPASFLTNTGYPDEAISYLKKAQALTPGKQLVYFQLGGAYIAKAQYKEALAVFKQAYDLAPEYQEARIIYLVGAIYAGDNALANSLQATLPVSVVVNDDRIAGALMTSARYSELENLLAERIKLNPKDSQGYISLAATYLKAGDKAMSIKTLEMLSTVLPDYKTTADQYIKGIKDGTIK
ncbi:hypothetical protein BH11PAT1_BH11PAT1_1470 [soil metagenome]